MFVDAACGFMVAFGSHLLFLFSRKVPPSTGTSILYYLALASTEWSYRNKKPRMAGLCKFI